MKCKKLFAIVLLWLTPLLTVTQKCEAQYVANYNPNEELFNYEVKIIDEFIERFNDEPTSYLRKIYQQANKPYTISRSMLLVSLFDLQKTFVTDKDTVLKSFFKTVLDKSHPVSLSFSDSNWYAATKAVFKYKGKAVEIPIVLHVRGGEDGSVKWMIAGAGTMTNSKVALPSISVSKPDPAKVPTYISTSAYASDFIEFHYILYDKIRAENFFEPEALGSNNCKQLLEMLKSGQLTFQYVQRVTYHFYQVDGWTFSVDRVERKTTNSGWLISSIQHIPPAEKEASRRKLLGY